MEIISTSVTSETHSPATFNGKKPSSCQQLKSAIRADREREDAELFEAGSTPAAKGLKLDRPMPSTNGEQNKATSSHKEFLFSPLSEVVDSVGPVDWLIEGIIEAGSLCLLFGDPGSYKSFLALDWALSVATGTKWNGRSVKKGPVFILMGEGHNGYGRRIKAWAKEGTNRDISNASVFVSHAPAQLLDQQSAIAAAEAIQALQKEYGKPSMVIFDTLARNFGPGDENSTADMTRFVAVLDTLIDKDVTCLLVHHTGHGDKQRGRGSSALKAALDAEFHLERKSDKVTLHCRKMKDAPEFPPISFEPEVVDIGTDEQPMTSLYLRHIGKAAPLPQNLSPNMRQALSLIDSPGNEKRLRSLNEWRDVCVEEGIYTRTSFYAAVKKLEDREIISITDGYVQLSSEY